MGVVAAALIATGSCVAYLWVAVSIATTGRRVWPWAPCRRCGGSGRWAIGATGTWRERLARGQRAHVYCQVCHTTGVRWSPTRSDR